MPTWNKDWENRNGELVLVLTNNYNGREKRIYTGQSYYDDNYHTPTWKKDWIVDDDYLELWLTSIYTGYCYCRWRRRI